MRRFPDAFPLLLRRKLERQEARRRRYHAASELVGRDPGTIVFLICAVGLLLWMTR
jgi:hypothetical protein